MRLSAEMSDRTKRVPEEYIWRTMECLAKALHACEEGSENFDPLGGWATHIMHFDLKPQNSEFLYFF